MLRTNSQIHVDNINGYSKYTFVERPNSRLDNKLIFVEQAYIDNTKGVTVYSSPDLILLVYNYVSFSKGTTTKYDI